MGEHNKKTEVGEGWIIDRNVAWYAKEHVWFGLTKVWFGFIGHGIVEVLGEKDDKSEVWWD